METPSYENASQASRIYFLPNLMTAGNLFCGFAAIMSCVEAKFTARIELIDTLSIEIQKTPAQLYERAILFILAGVVFDSLDGRLARLGGQESLFGKEFDSLADIVTFGIAPALLVMFMLLSPTQDLPVFRLLGWVIGFFYLACSAIRLARFNVITSPLLKPDERLPKYDFLGLPVPAAAGTIASIVMVMNRLPEKMIPVATFILPPFLLLVALLMVSTVHYPSFKHIDWNTRIKLQTLVLCPLGIFLIYQFHYFAIAAIFISYLIFGISRHLWRMRKPSHPSPEILSGDL
ncbi:MAG TPA: CDP-diacylglycerol--serine O-phosphatidyltransferase [Opitutales bacterium]|nr:CDP-diacylglycerol--serine O-phosphatidyltransferase [Opitutales bacterium]